VHKVEKHQFYKFVNDGSRSINSTNLSMMVRSVVVLNELKGKVKVVEKNESG
jgi:hypothetical protein